MKQFLSAIASILFIVTTTGCATVTYHDRFGKSGNEMAEFDDFNGKYRIYQGYITDDNLVRGGKQYYHLQFKGVLAGEGRTLNILIPYVFEYGVEPVLYETGNMQTEGKKAYLVLVRYCCPEDYSGIFDPIPSRETEKSSSAMKQYLALKFPGVLSEDKWPVIFCELSLTNVKKFNLIYKRWNPSSSGKDIAVYGSALEVPYSRMDIKWEKRSQVINIMTKAGYIFPVVFDIVTSPIQLIGLIIYFAAGGAVK